MRTRWGRWILAAVAALFLGLTAYPVLAQSTGGSFGGGSFGGGGGYSGGGGGFSGGSYSGGGGSYTYSGGGGGGSLPCTCSVPLFIGVMVLILVIGQMNKKNRLSGGPYRTHHGARGWNQVDISAIRLGIDWRARRDIQAKLEQLARAVRPAHRRGWRTSSARRS